MNKKAYFGFELLLIIISILVFFQFLFFSENDFLNSQELLVRSNENHYVFADVMEYDSSFLGLQAWFCNNSAEGFAVFNESSYRFLEMYSSKEFLLHAWSDAGEVFVTSTGAEEVCLDRARVLIFSDSSYCGKVINFEFSLYTSDEVGEC